MTLTGTVDNKGLHLDRIISSISCMRHAAAEGSPCWTIDSLHGPLRAICDYRAREAGAKGKITPYKKALASNSKKESSR